MCGIIGYNGKKDCLSILIDGLKTLEYRGYDSAGVAVSADEVHFVKARGRLSELEKKLAESPLPASVCGIGHTRWATHGAPSDTNSHPHTVGKVTLVHNGIIENYAELESDLAPLGYTVCSDTDTERAAALIDLHYSKTGDPIKAIRMAASEIRGSFAFGIIFSDKSDRIYAVRKDSPLIVAKSEHGCHIASDIPAILAYTREYYRPEENVIAELTCDDVRFFDSDCKETPPVLEHVDWNVEEAKKGGYAHFMLKEIFESADAIRRTLEGRTENDLPKLNIELPKAPERIHVVACGTAMHAGLIGKNLFEALARIYVDVETAGEFRYRDVILGENDLVIAISQSGETADTLAALRHAKAKGAKTLAIVNVCGSSIAREADSVIYTNAGPEIAVASTKAYSVQCALITLLALHYALEKGKISADETRTLVRALCLDAPRAVEAILEQTDAIKAASVILEGTEHAFYIGRGIDAHLCTEGSLKLKEISYIHSEAYAASELKHGTISLVEEGTPIVALMTVPQIAEKTVSAIREVRSRGARVLAIATEPIARSVDIPAEHLITIPELPAPLSLFPAVTVLQLLAYHTAAARGLDVDKPRNLAKSVTVE